MNYKKSNGLNYILISDTALFQGCSPVETEKLLSGMPFLTASCGFIINNKAPQNSGYPFL